MARSRGYHSYRGRRSKGKVALAILLVLVILAAVAVILLQERIVYDESGMPHLEIPWQTASAEEEEPPADLDLVIQTPEKTVGEVRAFSMPVGTLTQEGLQNALSGAALPEDQVYNAVAVTLKDDAGSVYFDSDTAVSGSVKTAGDTAAAIAEITGESTSYYTIACISCFHDPKAAAGNVEALGLKNTGGYIFYDGNNSQWLDPAKPAARRYLCDLAVEAAKLGFDEILLTDVSYPTAGKLEKIAYGETPRNTNLLTFLEELQAALEPYNVVLSLEVPTGVITAGEDEAAGLVLAELAPKVDRIYAAAQPEEVESLSAAVTAAGEGTGFVPELAETGTDVSGSWLIR